MLYEEIPTRSLMMIKLRRVRGSNYSIYSKQNCKKHYSTLRVWPRNLREDNMTCIWPSTVMFNLFHKHYTLTKKVWGRHCGQYTNILRGDKVPSFVPSGCYSGLIQPMDLSCRTEYVNQCLLLRMSIIISDTIILPTTNICSHVFSFHDRLLLVLLSRYEYYIFTCTYVCPFDCTMGSEKFVLLPIG